MKTNARKITLIIPKAKWLKSKRGYPDRILTCSCCGFEYDSTNYCSPKFEQNRYSFCPNCGKKMDLEE